MVAELVDRVDDLSSRVVDARGAIAEEVDGLGLPTDGVVEEGGMVAELVDGGVEWRARGSIWCNWTGTLVNPSRRIVLSAREKDMAA